MLLLLCVFASPAQPGSAPRDIRASRTETEQRTARCFESIRQSPPQEIAFLLKMPKGGDLHNHLSGAIYSESYIQWAADNGPCINTDPNSKFVALNLVQPEDSLASMQNFSLQMQMLNFLRPLFLLAHVSLHAGELSPGLVPPNGLSFHVRESVTVARAERIGHGVDIMHESDPYGLLKEMARRDVMIEICLSSNDLILGVSGPQHPLATYLKYGVPVALATDDEEFHVRKFRASF